MKLIFVDGTVGAGKSTLLDLIETEYNNPRTYIRREPVERYDETGLLTDCVQGNLSRNNLLQQHIFHVNLDIMMNIPEDCEVAFIERGCYAGKWVFSLDADDTPIPEVQPFFAEYLGGLPEHVKAAECYIVILEPGNQMEARVIARNRPGEVENMDRQRYLQDKYTELPGRIDETWPFDINWLTVNTECMSPRQTYKCIEFAILR